MGSDLYMESRSFSPGPDKVYWVDEVTLVVEKEYFYDGYNEVWRGNPVGHESVLKAFGVTVPEKPVFNYSLRKLATLLHTNQCNLAHEDQCSWDYEHDLDKDPWAGRAHQSWLKEAEKVKKKLPNFTIEEIMKVVEVVT